jgi:CheY-like chemotaxis protein
MILSGARVLVVEDESMVSMLIEDYLDHLGCKVAGTASSLDEAVTKARSLDLDVALLDLNLNGKLSYPVADVLHSRGIPFIVATGYGRANLPDWVNAVSVLSKPFGLDQLASALRDASDG